ncbi:putative T-box protein 7 [Varroa destructor]|uniref:T-box domain-containing protein n=1 Tax=Varroa destructor TaxID=109461 RepID=A0A7M7KBV7_VARDE|nr:putative T-box protein 7 [Varroa destructor]
MSTGKVRVAHAAIGQVAADERERLEQRRALVVARLRGLPTASVTSTPKKSVRKATVNLYQPSVSLLNSSLYNCQMRMKISARGRRMMPAPKAQLTGLHPMEQYNVWLEFVGSSGHRECFRHPDSPKLGSSWMRDTVRFDRVKLYTYDENRRVVHDGAMLKTSQLYSVDMHIAQVEDSGHMPRSSHRKLSFVQPWFRPFNAGDPEPK